MVSNMIAPKKSQPVVNQEIRNLLARYRMSGAIPGDPKSEAYLECVGNKVRFKGGSEDATNELRQALQNSKQAIITELNRVCDACPNPVFSRTYWNQWVCSDCSRRIAAKLTRSGQWPPEDGGTYFVSPE